MADKNCPQCDGSGRIPWPEAGMLQDCPCVRAARDPAPAPAPAPEDWTLPAPWVWHYDRGYYQHWAATATGTGVVYQQPGGWLNEWGTPAPAAVLALVRARNAATPGPGIGPRSP